MQYVGELHFLKAQVLSCVQNSIDKNREWQDECKRECFMAYVVFGVMGKKEGKRRNLQILFGEIKLANYRANDVIRLTRKAVGTFAGSYK